MEQNANSQSQSITPSSTSNRKLILTTVGILITGIVVGAVATALLSNNPSEQLPDTKEQASIQPEEIKESTFVTEGATETDFNLVGRETARKKVGIIKRYTSYKYGLTFTIFEENIPGDGYRVTEDGNKLWVHYSGEKKEDGQSIEVFTKSADETLADAINREFLTEHSPEQCFVQVTEAEANPGVLHAQISFPITVNENEPWWANSKNCPENYSKTNGVRYFIMDEEHPDKYAFLSIGQYIIDGNANYQGWHDTLEFID